MIAWWGIVRNGLWIAGLALILAALSLANYQAQVTAGRLRDRLAAPGFRLPCFGGLLLFCLGLALSSPVWWQQVLWGLLAIVWGQQVIWVWKR